MNNPRLENSFIPITDVVVSAYTVPTDLPESDGTLEWNSTTIILVEIYASDKKGLGYTYADKSVAQLINEKLAKIVKGRNALSVSSVWLEMVKSIRNLGRPGICSMAISAIDIALWDLKARLLDIPLATLLDAAHKSVPIYGSGGFTSYTDKELETQFEGWANQSISKFKMKVGRNPSEDIHRVKVARKAIGNNAQLFVDANGGYSRKQALAFAEAFREFDVSWFEEPVSSDDLEGLRLLRDRSPADMDIAAGEYGYDLPYFHQMLQSGAVDVLQADATRCGGFTVFTQVGALCHARCLELSAHTSPQLHAHASCAVIPIRHVEYFHDHVRIENMFFEGVLIPENGMLSPDLSRAGHGLELKSADIERYLV